MNIREQILFEVKGNIKEVKTKESNREVLNSFLESFFIDAQEYGLNETTEMYGMIFGKNVESELSLLKEGFEKELENRLDESRGSERAQKFSSPLLNGSKPSRPTSNYRDSASAAPSSTPSSVPFLSPGAADKGSAIDTANAAAGTSGLAGIWNSIKGFVTTGWEGIKAAFAPGGGGIGAILASPLGKGILGAGGVALGVAVLRKLFKKANKNQEPSKEVQEKWSQEIERKKAQLAGSR